MKILSRLFLLSTFVLVFACTEEEGYLSSDKYSGLSSADFSSSSSSSSSDNGNNYQSGLITAGEWNDLDNWDFWNNLLAGQGSSTMSDYWSIYTNNRISVQITSNNVPVINAKVELLKNEFIVWTSRTDNYGKAELWLGLFQEDNSLSMDNLSLKVNEQLIQTDLTSFENGINEISIDINQDDVNRVEISFIVDATGSMGDELEFLKEDLKSVIQTVQNDNADITILTSTVFYRDEGDDYVTKMSEFTGDLDKTIDFISQQQADGGGDFPEAVHTALDAGINELQWSTNAKTRIAFLLLDAPPHYETEIKESIHTTISDAAEKGIKVIPITASGIDKETEFLMRFISISTNGTYVFITNDSGIGNDHLEASVGDYQVEDLNDLMVRLINKYTE
jgi:hypothetical protein